MDEGRSFRRHDRVAVAPDDPLVEVCERAPDQVREVVAPEKRAQDFHVPHRGDVANGLAVADREIVLRVVEVEKPARVLVDHPLVPVEHQLEAINERACAFQIARVRIVRGRHECASIPQ